MIIFGSRMYFRKKVVRSFGQCAHCGVYGKQVSYQARNFGHLYFIPLIPLGGRTQVLNECKRCSMGVQLPIANLESLVPRVTEQFRSWIMEIQEGKNVVDTDDGETENVGVLIAGILENLFCLGEIQSIESISEILRSQGMDYENHLVLGRWYELQGDLQNAAASYESAHQQKPDDPVVLNQLATVLVNQGNSNEAINAYGKLLVLDPTDLGAIVGISSIHEAAKDFPHIVESYDQIFALRPDLVQDKSMKKTYKKACKKSGVQGKYLNVM